MLKLDAGQDVPKTVRAFIEIPKGSHIKYEYDEKTGFIKVDRILHTSMVYPYNYGFIPGTLGEDGDPLDIMVISSESFAPGITVMSKPIGVLLMKDEEGIDTKVMAVPVEKIDPDNGTINDIGGLGEHTKALIGHFFSYYKSIEPGKWAKVEGWDNATKAQDFVNKALDRAKKEKK
ncbi:MAG: inorganic diphosphatase [Candidatus Marsarchaeota archaeon]|nr:inorganic diphosphatase [Candidatus Marsarchaeota archaeon]MCL5412887.1 inorganic diphosphatase [Candidatus Marsarchaeota archaeon]